MADAVVTIAARIKMVKARAGVMQLPAIVGMAFGDGGVDENGEPIAPSSSDTALKNEVFRKVVDNYEFVSDTTCRYFCTLSVDECVDVNINELALYDAEGDLVAIKTFKNKGKDADLEMTFRVDDVL
ncbi:MAG: hypothetical protein HFI33_15310 [Lachnospiraceae bacterium]|nr:hypothetical protein [Lachnospiraceae bacterium]